MRLSRQRLHIPLAWYRQDQNNQFVDSPSRGRSGVACHDSLVQRSTNCSYLPILPPPRDIIRNSPSFVEARRPTRPILSLEHLFQTWPLSIQEMSIAVESRALGDVARSLVAQLRCNPPLSRLELSRRRYIPKHAAPLPCAWTISRYQGRRGFYIGRYPQVVVGFHPPS